MPPQVEEAFQVSLYDRTQYRRRYLHLKLGCSTNLLKEERSIPDLQLPVMFITLNILAIFFILFVTQTLFGSRTNWIYDPAPPAPLCILVIRLCILVILLCLLAIPRRPPLPLAHHQELLSPCLSPENADKGGGEGLAAQPIGIQRPTQLPQ